MLTEKQIENNIGLLRGQDEGKVNQWLRMLRLSSDDVEALGKRLGMKGEFSLEDVAERLSNL